MIYREDIQTRVVSMPIKGIVKVEALLAVRAELVVESGDADQKHIEFTREDVRQSVFRYLYEDISKLLPDLMNAAFHAMNHMDIGVQGAIICQDNLRKHLEKLADLVKLQSKTQSGQSKIVT